MSLLCVTGYASLDHVLHLGGSIGPDRTTQGRRDPRAWPRAGGCPTHIARAASAAGQAAAPVMWVGDDAGGATLRAELAAAGAATEGIAALPGARSPAAVMAYQPDGSCACLFDPGFAGQEQLDDAQRAKIAGASHLCLSVGPGHLTADILALRAPGARLYWAVKNDPSCFSPVSCATLSAEADVIFCSAAERGMIGATGAIVTETLGAEGVRLCVGDRAEILSVDPIDVADTTGAGDTLIGGFIAAEMAGKGPHEATQAGIAAAAALLRGRREERR